MTKRRYIYRKTHGQTFFCCCFFLLFFFACFWLLSYLTSYALEQSFFFLSEAATTFEPVCNSAEDFQNQL